MGAAAVAAVAATAGVAVAASAGYGIYRLVKNKTEAGGRCPWCDKGTSSESGDGIPPAEKGRPGASPAKTVEKKSGAGVAVGDYFLRTEEEMIEFALKCSLEESLSLVSPSDGEEGHNPQDGDGRQGSLLLDEFDCPICAEVIIFLLPYRAFCQKSRTL